MKETTKDKPGKGDKISPIRIDQEVLDDPRMDEFIRESLKKEADELEAELNSDPSLEGIKAPDDMFEKLVAKLKEEGVWEEEAEEPEEKGVPADCPAGFTGEWGQQRGFERECLG